MAYARSTAFKAFQSRVAELHHVVNAAGRLRIGGKRNQAFRDAMLSSTVLLSFAYFEAYVSDVIDDVCKALCSHGLQANSLPKDIRAHVAVAANLKSWIDIQDPAKQRLQIWAYKGGGGFDLLNDSTIPVRIDVDPLLSGISYPKLDNVRKLLTRLGVEEPVKKLREKGGHAITQKLISIHDARAELAHTGRMPTWALADYTDRLNGLTDFARAMDKVLYRYVAATVPSNKWIR